MNENLEKFRKLLLTDGEFQKKLVSANEAYAGEKTEKAIFENVLVPVAEEYGISATYEEFQQYISDLASLNMSDDELAQIAGGDKGYNGGGLCGADCKILGAGFGVGAGEKSGNICLVIGVGYGETVCAAVGYSN